MSAIRKNGSDRSDSRKIIQVIDPLVDPAIVYFILAGLVKPVIFALVDATAPDMLVQPIVGRIWGGFDALVVSSSISYLMCAGLLILVRCKNRGIEFTRSISGETARRLTILVIVLALSSIAEAYVLGSRYVAVTILPVYIGWLTASSGAAGLMLLSVVTGLVYLAALSKWVVIGSVVAFSVTTSIVAGAFLFFVYPLLNQLRFFIIGLSLGLTASESFQHLLINPVDFAASSVSLLYRLQSFEGSYLVATSGIGGGTAASVSPLDLSQVVSFDIYNLEYGLAVSLFSQLEYVFGDPWLAGGGIFVFTILFVATVRPIVQFAPSLIFVLGLYMPLVLADGFVPHRSMYFATGVIIFLIFHSVARFRIRAESVRRGYERNRWDIRRGLQ